MRNLESNTPLLFGRIGDEYLSQLIVGEVQFGEVGHVFDLAAAGKYQ